MSLLNRFEQQFDRFMIISSGVMADMADFFGIGHDDHMSSSDLTEINLTKEHELTTFKRNIRLRTRFLFMLAILLFLIFVYLDKNYADTWS